MKWARPPHVRQRPLGSKTPLNFGHGFHLQLLASLRSRFKFHKKSGWTSPSHVLIQIQSANSCILCHLDCCNVALSSLSFSQQNTVVRQKLKNSAVHFIFNLKMKNRIKPYMKQLHFLTVRDSICNKLAILIFKAIYVITPYQTELIESGNPKRSICHQDQWKSLLTK